MKNEFTMVIISVEIVTRGDNMEFDANGKLPAGFHTYDYLTFKDMREFSGEEVVGVT